MRRFLRKQRGMTFIGWMFVVSIGLFFVLLGIKIFPTYIENYSIKGILKSLQGDPLVRGATPLKIRRLVERRMLINSVYNFDPKNILIKKIDNKFHVQIKYEVRKKMAGNIDAVISFDDKVIL